MRQYLDRRRFLVWRCIGRWYVCIQWRRPAGREFVVRWRRSPGNAYSASVIDLGTLSFVGGCIH